MQRQQRRVSLYRQGTPASVKGKKITELLLELRMHSWAREAANFSASTARPRQNRGLLNGITERRGGGCLPARTKYRTSAGVVHRFELRRAGWFSCSFSFLLYDPLIAISRLLSRLSELAPLSCLTVRYFLCTSQTSDFSSRFERCVACLVSPGATFHNDVIIKTR